MRVVWLVVSLVSIVSGCAGSLRGAPPAALTIVNESDFEICGVYVAPASSASAAPNRLPPGRSLPPGYQQTFPLDVGRFDIRLDDCADRTLYARRNVAITGSKRLDFRPVEVHRKPIYGARRFASIPSRAF